MEIEDLFYNVPARLKFLKNEKTEMAYITEMVQAIALSHPETAFTLKHKNTTTLQTFGGGDLLNTISEIYSPELADELNKIYKKDELSNLEITGYISNPSYTRSSNKSIYLSVNNRTVKDALILKTIYNVCQNLIPKGKYPFVVLNLNINPDDVDVNVHPTKKEVRYKNSGQIFNFVYAALNEALSGHIQNNTYSFASAQHQENFNTSPFSESETSQPKTFSNMFSPSGGGHSSYDTDCVYVSDRTAEQRVSTEKLMQVYERIPEAEQKVFEVNTDEIVQSKIIGQLDNTYILVENEDNLEIIDQHIAQERYLYEKLKEEREISSQGLLFSDILNLEPQDVETLKKNYDTIKKFGYGIEFLSDREVTFRKLPSLIAGKEPQQIIASLLDEIYNNQGSIEDKILISMACRGSVKANTKLLPSQMEDIVSKWRLTKQPATCPHGRPISKKIPKSQIAAFFLRQ